MSRTEPSDDKNAIVTKVENLKALAPCAEAVSFCEGRNNEDTITPAQAIDDFEVKHLLYGIMQIKTRDDTEERLRGIAQTCCSEEYDIRKDTLLTILSAYDVSSTNALDKEANDEKWKTAIINEFRE